MKIPVRSFATQTRGMLMGVAALFCVWTPMAGASSDRVAPRVEAAQAQPEGIVLTEAEMTTIPEPGAIAMLLGGFGTLLGFQRLRRRH